MRIPVRSPSKPLFSGNATKVEKVGSYTFLPASSVSSITDFPDYTTTQGKHLSGGITLPGWVYLAVSEPGMLKVFTPFRPNPHSCSQFCEPRTIPEKWQPYCCKPLRYEDNLEESPGNPFSGAWSLRGLFRTKEGHRSPIGQNQDAGNPSNRSGHHSSYGGHQPSGSH